MRFLRLFGMLTAIAVTSVAIATYFIPGANSAPQTINTLGTDGVAIRGYDPVAYFTEGAPRKGKAEFTVEHKGAKWQFASAEHKAMFEANPEKYTPAYGGFCAYGVAQDYLVKIEPDAWAIRDGKLYLNYDQNIQRRWSQKPDEYIATADKKWPGLVTRQ